MRVAIPVLGLRRGETGSAVEKTLDSFLAPIASVAFITGAGAGLMAPAVLAGGFSDMQISVIASHVNDSGLWLVGRLFGMNVSTAPRTWTVQQTLESVVAFAIAVVIFLLF